MKESKRTIKRSIKLRSFFFFFAKINKIDKALGRFTKKNPKPHS